MRSTHPKATSISTGLAAALDAQHTKTAHVIHATGDIKEPAIIRTGFFLTFSKKLKPEKTQRFFRPKLNEPVAIVVP